MCNISAKRIEPAQTTVAGRSLISFHSDLDAVVAADVFVVVNMYAEAIGAMRQKLHLYTGTINLKRLLSLSIYLSSDQVPTHTRSPAHNDVR